MASLDEFRAQNPEYRDIPDAALADTLHREFYSDIPRDEFNAKIGFKPGPETRKVTFGDVLTQAGRDVVKAVTSIPGVPQRVGEASEAWRMGERTAENAGTVATEGGGFGLKLGKQPFRTGAAPETAPAAAVPEAAPAAPDALGRLAEEARAADRALADPPDVVSNTQMVDDAARAKVEADRVAAAAPDRAGNINLDRIYAPEDVKAAIKQTAADNADFMSARRGVVTQAETRDMAAMLGMSADDLAKRRTGQAFNAEEMFAARELLVSQATKVRDLARTAERGSEAQKAQFAAEVTRLVAIQEQVAGATAEAGRALAQFRMLAGATKDEIARIVDASKASGIDDMAKAIAQLDDPGQVAAFAANAYKAKTSDMLFEAWINALLSGPKTHAANLLGNSLTTLWQIPEGLTAAAISKATGSGITAREAVGRVAGFIEGAKEGIVAGWRAYRTEQTGDLATKLETRSHRAVPSANVLGMEIGGKQVRIPGRLLMAQDEFFKAINFRGEINAQAIRQAEAEGLKGQAFGERVAELRANPTETMTQTARNVAEKNTFTNPLGEAGKALQTFVREVPGLRYIVPFVRTPLNVVKYAAERSPFAPLFQEVRTNLSGKNGKAARDNQIARIALGSTVSAVATYLAAEGAITGGGPKDPAKRALLYADGWQPYSVRLGDTYYSYSRLEPFGMLMGVAADGVEMWDQMSKDEKANFAALLMGSVSRNLVSKTWLKGPSETLEAISDPDRYGPRWVQRMASTLVPTGVGQVAQDRDPFIRDARTVLDNVRAKIPGEREKLFVRRDPFGEPIKREGPVGPDLISPIYQSVAKNDPTIAELQRLKITPGRLPRTVRNVELADSEYDAYSQNAGQTMKAALDALVSLPQWRELPEAVQAEAMEDAIRKSRDVARTQLFAAFPDLPLRVAAETIKRKRLNPPAQ